MADFSQLLYGPAPAATAPTGVRTPGQGLPGMLRDKAIDRAAEAAQKKLDASTAEYVEAKAKLEEETKRSELVDKLGPRGLKETTNPAKVIRVKKED
jgi:hypothetical protein